MMPEKMIRMGCSCAMMAGVMAVKANKVKRLHLIDAALTPNLEPNTFRLMAGGPHGLLGF
jgi:hypothetical protein